MSWNYRIVRYPKNQGFGLHEVHYDEDGKPWGVSKDATTFACDVEEGVAGIIQSLQMAIDAAKEHPVFDPPKKGKWPGKAPEGTDEADGHRG